MQYKKGNGRKPGPTTNQKPPGSYCYTSGQCFAKLGTTFKTFRPKIKKFVGILQLNCCKLHAAYPFDNYETDHYEQVAGKYGIENPNNHLCAFDCPVKMTTIAKLVYFLACQPNNYLGALKKLYCGKCFKSVCSRTDCAVQNNR